MTGRVRLAAVAFAVFLGSCGDLRAQSAPAPQPQVPADTPAAPSSQLLRVFLDCRECDEEYLRQNVGFVDYVRDRTVADLHVLVTTQNTGGGGRAWTVRFIGLDRLQRQERTLSFDTPQTATDDDRRKEFARIFRIGLVGFAAGTTVLPQLDVTWKKPAEASQTSATKDPWNFWVFRLNLNGNLNGERSSTSGAYRVNASANRTTDRWKVNLNANGNYNANRFEVGDDEIVTSVSEGWNLNALAVKSLGPKWSIGGRASAGHSSFSNNQRSYTVAPGIEYDFFPYSESARRSVTLQYSAGISLFKYSEVTVFDKLTETVPNHRLVAMVGLRQPWGSLEIQSTLSEHLNHPDRYRWTLFGSSDVRLFKGFSFNAFGNYEKINDQISLRKNSATTEEVLLRVQQLATSYSYFVSFGITYSFGSIFNNIVNTRFGG